MEKENIPLSRSINPDIKSNEQRKPYRGIETPDRNSKIELPGPGLERYSPRAAGGYGFLLNTTYIMECSQLNPTRDFSLDDFLRKCGQHFTAWPPPVGELYKSYNG